MSAENCSTQMHASHSFTHCPLHSDPGAVEAAPFANTPPSDPRAFVSMCDNPPGGREGCPPVGLCSGSGLGCASGGEGPCYDASPSMYCFFGVPPDAPAIWTSLPELRPLRSAPTK